MKKIIVLFLITISANAVAQTHPIDKWLAYFSKDGGQWWSKNENYQKGNGQSPYHTYQFIWDEELKHMIVEIAGVDNDGNVKSYWKGKTIADYTANKLKLINESTFGVYGFGEGKVINDSTYVITLEMISPGNPKQLYTDTTFLKSEVEFVSKSYIADTSQNYIRISESTWYHKTSKLLPVPDNPIIASYIPIPEIGFSLIQEVMVDKSIIEVWRKFTNSDFFNTFFDDGVKGELKTGNELIITKNKKEEKYLVFIMIPYKAIVLKEESNEEELTATFLFEKRNNMQTKITLYQEIYSTKPSAGKKLAIKKVEADQLLTKIKLLLER